MLSKDKTINLGSLYPTRDFSYIKDTVNGFVCAAKYKQSIGEIINIGSGHEISINNLVKLIGRITGADYKVKEDKKRVRPKKGEVDRLKASNKKANALIKWKPVYSGKEGLRKGLIETIDWFTDSSNLKNYKSKIYNI